MLHFSRLPVQVIPFDATLFSGVQPRTGLTLNLRFICLDNNLFYDWADNTFKSSPGTPTSNLAAQTGRTHRYFKNVDIGGWRRAHYRAIVTCSTTAEEWETDFTVGIKADRRLGYSAVYDGAILTLSAWVEEDGIVQSDYTDLDSVNLYDASGSVVASGWNPSGPTNGIFKFQQTVSLPANTNYVFSCSAICPGAGGLSDLSFPLRVGLSRP